MLSDPNASVSWMLLKRMKIQGGSFKESKDLLGKKGREEKDERETSRKARQFYLFANNLVLHLTKTTASFKSWTFCYKYLYYFQILICKHPTPRPASRSNFWSHEGQALTVPFTVFTFPSLTCLRVHVTPSPQLAWKNLDSMVWNATST